MAWKLRGQSPQYQGRSKLVWEKLRTAFLSSATVERAKVPGGWLVMAHTSWGYGVSINFYPDPNHEWDGGSLP